MKYMVHGFTEQVLASLSVCTLIAASFWASTSFSQSGDVIDLNDAVLFEGVVGNGCRESGIPEADLDTSERGSQAMTEIENCREFVVTNTFYQGLPVMAVSSTEDLILQRAASGSTHEDLVREVAAPATDGESTSEEAETLVTDQTPERSMKPRDVLSRVQSRAQFLCALNGYRGASRYHFGFENLPAYMSFDDNGVMGQADAAQTRSSLSEPLVGLARGFVWVRCFR